MTLAPLLSHADTLRPFSTDGCTAFPDGTVQTPRLWLHCCVAHDLKYWAGGTYQDRLVADRELHSCVVATGHPKVARTIFAGVRIGGTPFVMTPWRWGYGWNEIRGYTPLNEDELEQVASFGLEL